MLTRADYISITVTETTRAHARARKNWTIANKLAQQGFHFFLQGVQTGCKHVKKKKPDEDVIMVGQAAKLLMLLYGGKKSKSTTKR